MPVEILIHAIDHNKAEKGFMQDVRDVSELDERPWGGREGPPNYIILTISDAEKSQILHFMDNWKNEFTYEKLAENAQGRRYKISVNLKVIQQFGIDKGIRAEVNDFLQNEYGAVLVNYVPAQGYATYDIPNTDWQAMKSDLLDLFEEQVDTRRYRFTPSDVDLAVAAGGSVTLNTAQALARVIDRLA